MDRYLIGTLILIICLILALIYSQSEFNGFIDYPSFLESKYSDVIPQGATLFASGNEGALGTDTTTLTGTFSPRDGNVKGGYKLKDGKTGTAALIAKCEAVKTDDCSAFDDPTFGTDCGLCIELGGEDHAGKVSLGGRVLLQSHRESLNEIARNSIEIPKYKADIGTCPANRLVTTKGQCLKLKDELKCQKAASFDQPGCVQCNADSSYTILDSSLIAGSGILSFNGSGILNFRESGFAAVTKTLSNQPTVIPLQGSSMTQFTCSVTPNALTPDAPISILGYVSGATSTGEFVFDFYRLIITDAITGRKPRTNGKVTINGVGDVNKLVPGFGKKEMNLIGNSPFTFAEPQSEEAIKCNSPFLITAAAAEFLGTDPCYAKGSGPGNFSQDCLQSAFLSNGCVQAGTGYPTTDAKRTALLVDPATGANRTLNEIASYIYNQAVIAATGMLNGQSLEITEWSAASEFCTGTRITSPCDTPAKTSGPLSKECLSFLWLNRGNGTPLGSTYTESLTQSLSSDGTKVEYCKATGTMSPLKPAGFAYWKTKGGVESVKSQMNTLFTNANTNRGPANRAMEECYGTFRTGVADSSPASTSSTTNPCEYPSGSDVQGVCATRSFSPTVNKRVGTVNIPNGDYMMSFTITPKGIVRDWSNLIHVTTGGNYPAFGMRAPGIWFTPGTTQLHIRLGDSTDGNWGLDASVACPMNQATPVSIVASGKNVTIQVGVKTYNLVQPTRRPTGSGYIVYMSDPWYPAMNAIISNFSYKIDGVVFIPSNI